MKYYCINNCGKEVSGEGRRCYSCANKKENNPNWLGGKDEEKYEGFSKELRQQIHYRDHFTCQICGSKMTTFGKKTDKLEIHHIDYNKANSVPKNLVSLCKSCHIKTNFNRPKWIQFFKDLFKKRGLYGI
jgi:5-methylcytosine-specific restriction endonuclease McrA